MSNESRRITFTGANGAELAARLDLPDGRERPLAYALFAHCFTCNKDIFAASRVSRSLAELGIAVLRFDFTGLGASAGEFANTNFSSNVADLLAAAEYLRTEHAAPKLLIGHSLGGAAVLAAASEVPEAVAVATIGAPAEPAHVEKLFCEVKPEIEEQGEAEVQIAGRSFRIQKQFLEDIDAQKQQARIAKLGKALMVFHSPIDNVVGIDNARAIFEAAKHPKSFVSLDHADHLISSRSDAVYVAHMIATWAARYIEPEVDEELNLKDSIEATEGHVIVAETGEGKFVQTVAAGKHLLRADEPRHVKGGLDTGPSPYDYLLVALGACTSMTLRMYADHKELPLERVLVDLKHDKVHAKDCAECDSKTGKVDVIERELEIEGPLTDQQRQRLLEIADRCPVHRTLTEAEVVVRSKLR